MALESVSTQYPEYTELVLVATDGQLFHINVAFYDESTCVSRFLGNLPSAYSHSHDKIRVQ